MPSESKVCFFFEKNDFTLKNRKELKAFIETIFKKEKTKLNSLNYVFCSDKRVLEINRKFLKHNYYTDIITFDLSENQGIQAEIYISIDRIKENARSLGVPFKSELLRVIFHGVLHLVGFSDKTAHEKQKMRAKEDDYLSKWGVSRNTVSA